MMAGAIWDFAYAGYHDRIDPDGKLWSGKGDLNTVLGDLSHYEKPYLTINPWWLGDWTRFSYRMNG